jgi:putative heme iron utilization protein
MVIQCDNMANERDMTVLDKENDQKRKMAPDRWSKAIIRRALKASLATLDRETGYPYASLVTVSTLPDGSPLTLISTLAEHTKNLEADPRASLLFDETGGLGDPLEGARISVFGTMEKVNDSAARTRFLNRHPSAEIYADFTDFAFHALNIQGAHFVGGFGRITDIPADRLRTDISDAAELISAEPGIVEHMNADHADAVRLYATCILGAQDTDWRFVSCDPEGCDLVAGETGLRLDFSYRVTTPQLARKALAEFAKRARE